MGEIRKSILITGASSGIGYAVSKKFAGDGYKVFACARNVDPIRELAKRVDRGTIIPYKIDITDNNQIVELKDFLNDRLINGKLDILYNNAGQACTIPAVDAPAEAIEQCFRVNVIAHMNMCRELSQFVINAKGTIIFTGSVTGLISIPFITIYSATKSAIHQYARGLHLELRPFGVRVMNFVTGGVETSIGDSRPFPDTSIFNFKEGRQAFLARKKEVKKMSPDHYAEKIYNDVMSNNDPVDLYRGSFATIIRIVNALIPYFILKHILYRLSKLNKVEQVVSKTDNMKTH